ncbi:MAG: site-specific DNA-methyltransferase [Candidatus Liptonbacteria bacterium]|nr:site-specific DNA-methyltransferase [Candidatus Liptonbacteria bacterium]
MAQLNFKGKQFVQNHHLAVKYRELIPRPALSLVEGKDKRAGNVRLDDSLIIHGDNLVALKALLPTYAGKVKCIYIDPPYNTGNERWAYNDNVNSPMMQEWLGRVVDRDDLTRHDKWLCMMTPRLKLLRELLRDDGAIFISIDDNEQHHLRDLMDEVFGEENFITNFSIKANPRGRQSDENVATLHEYCLCYTRGIDEVILNGLPLTQENIDEYDQQDKDGKKWRELGLRQRGAASLREERPEMFFPIYVNSKNGIVSLEKTKDHTVEVFPRKSDGRDGRWMWGKKKVMDEINRIYGRKVSGRDEFDIFIKDYLNRNGEQKTAKPRSMWLDSEVNTELGGKLLKLILERKTIEYPKPLGLLKRIVEIATDKDSIILDSFAGSGTTAHAVLALNKEDGGNRKFILVEMEDYTDTITAERVRRVIRGVKTAKDENLKKGLGGTFSYFELGKPIEMESILSGKNLPSYNELARYVFYTATGEEFNEKKINEKKNFIGESKEYEVYLFYKPDLAYLKNTALTLDKAKELGKVKTKKRLVFAPTKYLDQEKLDGYRIVFAQLPFEIYKLAK